MSARVIRPQDGTTINPAMVRKIGRVDLPTGGIGIIEGVVAPGELIAPHTHADVDEVTYVLAGEITAEIGGEVVVAPTGSYVLEPSGVMHAFWNAAAEPARVMELHVPGGFEQFYADVTALGADAAADRDEGFRRLQAAYRIDHHPELIPDLKRRHGLP